MHARNRGSARIMFAGFGLLSLLIVVGLMMYMGGESTEKAVKVKKYVEETLPRLEEQHNRQIEDALKEFGTSRSPEGSYTVIVEEVGPDEGKVVREVLKLTGAGSAGLKRLLASPPARVAAGLTRSDADGLRQRLQRLGATVRIDKQRD